MRVISQDDAFDFPYENIMVARIENNVVCATMPNIEDKVLLGEYSSREKALKAMEMLRNAYVGLPILFQNVDMDESVLDKLKEWKRDGIVLLHDNAETKIEQVNNAIFKFPKDEEIEV